VPASPIPPNLASTPAASTGPSHSAYLRWPPDTNHLLSLKGQLYPELTLPRHKVAHNVSHKHSRERAKKKRKV
jgi:hypothetical protein